MVTRHLDMPMARKFRFLFKVHAAHESNAVEVSVRKISEVKYVRGDRSRSRVKLSIFVVKDAIRDLVMAEQFSNGASLAFLDGKGEEISSLNFTELRVEKLRIKDLDYAKSGYVGAKLELSFGGLS